MTRKGFRFIGHMAKRSQGIIHAVSSKNVPKAILETGINVLEMIGEVVKYNETTRQTIFMEEYERSVIESSKVREKAANIHHEQAMQMRQDQQIQELKLEQKKLDHSLDKLKQTMQTQYLLDMSATEADHVNQKLLVTYFKQFNRILSMTEECINCINFQDNESRQRLLEDFREVQKKMNQLIE